MRKFSLHIFIISLIFLSMHVAYSADEPSSGSASSINLRSSYRELSISQVQSIPNISIREKNDWGFYGHSTINHNYNLRSISGDKVVVDDATGLMWHQSGTETYTKYKEAKEWLEKLNRKGYAGCHDWRLPTVEEAASLLESSKSNDLYIDPVFSDKQRNIWTGDSKSGSEDVWNIHFSVAQMDRDDINSSHYVRPVRSMK